MPDFLKKAASDMRTSMDWRRRHFLNRYFPYPYAVWKFVRQHKRIPNLVHPVRLNDILLKRKLREPHELITRTTCKFEAKNFIRNQAGSEYVIPDFGAWDDPEMIPWKDLNYPVVIKPTSGCGHLMFLDVVEDVTSDKLETLRQWVNENYFHKTGEKNYRDVTQRLLVEKSLRPAGEDPFIQEYKFHCLQGKVVFINAVAKRLDKTTARLNSYSPEWVDLPFDYKTKATIREFDRPDNLEEMIGLAEKLADPFKYVRIDVYHVDGKVLVGEITHSTGSAMLKLSIPEFEYWVGAYYYSESGEHRI